jgi:glycosyltransferase involved in cell wall biosynthesis
VGRQPVQLPDQAIEPLLPVKPTEKPQVQFPVPPSGLLVAVPSLRGGFGDSVPDQKILQPNVVVHVFGGLDRDRGVNEQRSWKPYHGWIGPDEIEAQMNEMDAVVVPSRWEGFGLVVLEAMRCGKPVIVSDRGGLPELVIHGFNGLIFSFDDPHSLVRVLESLSRGDLRRLGLNCPAGV